eukprot:CAMPEP_0176242352 /NCGR_PEP_ID=MMETSP0121_2-20121125/30361_1 /TAXON_ID=160619 /ORGANISM="Kryptoperidinium foliaceum, Strain CCMP 1326" /LENGTH=244 /DNA_ID=CAMNT_0017581905 /DNA_START=528 /DNA_END=1260 /DNA_ORIENTATION=-
MERPALAQLLLVRAEVADVLAELRKSLRGLEGHLLHLLCATADLVQLHPAPAAKVPAGGEGLQLLLVRDVTLPAALLALGGAIFAATLPAGRWCGAPRSAASETALSSNTFMRPTEILSPPSSRPAVFNKVGSNLAAIFAVPASTKRSSAASTWRAPLMPPRAAEVAFAWAVGVAEADPPPHRGHCCGCAPPASAASATSQPENAAQVPAASLAAAGNSTSSSAGGGGVGTAGAAAAPLAGKGG